MQTISHIVAATDFSAKSAHAIQRAALICKALGAELHLINVIYPLDLYAGSELSFSFQTHYQQAQQHAIKSELQVQAHRLREQFHLTIHTATRIGSAHAEIATYADEVKAGLIVVGAQGKHSLLDKLLGSTSSRLMRVAKHPILIVKNEKESASDYRHIIAAVSFSPTSAEAAKLARTIAPQAHIETVLVFDTNQEAHMYKAGMNEALLEQYRNQALVDADTRLVSITAEQQIGENVSRKILTGYPPEAICQYAKDQRADLIAIGKHEKSHLEDWLLGSVSKGVVYAAQCDVLLNH